MKLTLGKKISLACASLVAITLGLGAVSVLYVSRLDSAVQSVALVSLPGTVQLAWLSQTAAGEERAMLKHMLADTPEMQARYESDLARLESRFQRGLREYGSDLPDAHSRELFARIAPAHEQVMREWSGAILPLSRAHNARDSFARWVSDMLPAVQAQGQALAAGMDDNQQRARRAAQATMGTGQAARIWFILLAILSVMAGIGLAYAVVRKLNRALRKVVNDLSRGAEQVAGAAGQISCSSQSLAQGTAEQAASLEQTSASTEEMTAMTRKNAENSESCAKLMGAVDARIAEANQSLDEMVTSMEEINASSDKISKIIKVIEEIAFQTNILALNAAVEAARAGEAGMGFAVVAGEVRNLAQRSSQAAKDTAVLIEESIAKSNGGTVKVSRAADAIQAIAESANKVKLLVDEVNFGSQEQARGMAQIAKAVVEIEQVTQRAAASSEETASASEELSAQAEAMRNLIEGVRQLAGGVELQVARKPAVRRNRAVSVAQREPAFPVAPGAARKLIPLDGDFKEF
jgi:methyl-accepting chemotaxis protein/methyl-accepting chemotaxis protein-1 (serine sensor receptor)